MRATIPLTQTTGPARLEAGATSEPPVHAAAARSCQVRSSWLSLVGRRRRPLVWAASLVAMLTVLIAACTPDPVPQSEDADHRGSETTTSSTADVPYVDGAEGEAQAFRVLRLLDPCALLVPDAGAEAVGGTADQLVPGPDPAECTLDVLPEGAQDSVDGWTVSVEIGVRFDDTDIELGATPQPVPGTPEGSFFRQESFSGDDCTIVRPLGEQDGDGYGGGYGIELEVRAPLLAETPSQPPCDIAVRYLESTTDRWLQPPARADELTMPRLPLTDRDPCAATAAIGDALGVAARAQPDSLYSCTMVFTEPVTDSSGRTTDTAPGDSSAKTPLAASPMGESVEVTFAITGDPASREPTTGIEPVTIAGRVGSLDRSLADSCVVQIAITDTIQVETPDGGRVQVVGVTAPSCETATHVATTVLDTVTDR